MSSESGKLTVIQKSGYALGIHGIMYFWYATNLYLFYFYTDVVGLTPAQTGTVFLLSLIWDGITDPIMGAIVDRLIARGWKYRPMVLIGGIPFCISFAALFYVPAGVEVFAYCLVANLVFRISAASLTAEAAPRAMLSLAARMTSNCGNCDKIAAVNCAALV